MLTAILIIFAVVVIVKVIGPLMVDLFRFAVSLFTIPLGFLIGLFVFLIEVMAFVGILWLIVTIFGL